MSEVSIITAFDDEPSIDEICEFVSNGGTLASYCKDHDLPFGEIRKWVRASDIRSSMYTEAISAREDHLAQLLCSFVYEIVKFDPGLVYNEDGTIKPVHQWPAGARAALMQMDVDTKSGKLSKVKFEGRLAAIKLLGSTIGMFADRVKVEGVQSLSDLVLKAGKDDSSSVKE